MPFDPAKLQLPTIKTGSKGPAVTAWQKFLFDQNLPMMNFDGDFGPITDQSTREYQTDHGLSVTGTVDQETYNKALEHSRLFPKHPECANNQQTQQSYPKIQ
jgi:peptidoglycan hydrolase-like protein with peptidoglycan-binding domain